MTEITKDMKIVEKSKSRRFFVLKNEKGQYWRCGDYFTDDISLANTYNIETSIQKQGKKLFDMYPESKRFKQLFVQEVKFVECN